jgi:hypothetical protein
MMVISTCTLLLVALQWILPPEEELEEDFWECENCGFIVYSSTIEGVVEGMRIHALAINCDFDKDADDI